MKIKQLFFPLLIIALFLQSCVSALRVDKDGWDKYAIEDDKSVDICDSLTTSTANNIKHLVDCYYAEYLEVPTTNQLLQNNYIEEKVGEEFARLFRDQSEYFEIFNDDWYVYVNYRNRQFLKYSINLWPYFWYEVAFEYNRFVGTIWAYKDGFFLPLEDEQTNYFGNLLDSCVATSLNEDCHFVSCIEKSIAAGLSTKKAIYLYQYNNEEGLTLHKISKQHFVLEINSYSKKLEAIAKQFCDRYGATKIIFSGYAMEANTSKKSNSFGRD